MFLRVCVLRLEVACEMKIYFQPLRMPNELKIPPKDVSFSVFICTFAVSMKLKFKFRLLAVRDPPHPSLSGRGLNDEW